MQIKDEEESASLPSCVIQVLHLPISEVKCEGLLSAGIAVFVTQHLCIRYRVISASYTTLELSRLYSDLSQMYHFLFPPFGSLGKCTISIMQANQAKCHGALGV